MDIATTGNSIYSQFVGAIKGAILHNPKVTTHHSNGLKWFSLDYFGKNLKAYLKIFLGSPINFLWKSSPMLPGFIAIPGILGWMMGLKFKKYREISLIIIFLILPQLLLLSIFYTVDGRYLFPVIPTLVIGLAIWFDILLAWRTTKKAAVGLLIIISIFYLIFVLPPLKLRMLLNIKYSETPWYYLSVLDFNNYFTKPGIQKTYIISSLPPYFIDFYSNGNYSLLPLSQDQDFFKDARLVWGEGNYSDLVNLYKLHLLRGENVYISTYGLGNEGYLHAEFNDILSNFNYYEVYSECYNLCKLYKLSLKK